MIDTDRDIAATFDVNGAASQLLQQGKSWLQNATLFLTHDSANSTGKTA